MRCPLDRWEASWTRPSLQSPPSGAWRPHSTTYVGLLEGNGSIPVYITLDAYRKLLAEKKKMNNLPVSTVLTAILERYDAIETTIKN